MPQVSVVIPAKRLSLAKTRLRLPDHERRAMARLLLNRTIRVATTSQLVAAVLVVTDDRLLASDAQALGATAVKEQPGGLNSAARQGRGVALAARPPHPVALLVADLPTLQIGDLDAAISEFEQLSACPHGLMVADRAGTGTTMLIHRPETLLPILFGRNSARAHRIAGYEPAQGLLTTLRADMDTPHDLTTLTGKGPSHIRSHGTQRLTLMRGQLTDR